ncbi:MAG: YceI family protein [Methylococcales bacterium]|nr:YceI family protein [Methylococcales bacterium]
MRRKLIHGVVGTLLMLTATFPVLAAEKLILDEEHSYVLWRINHLGFSTQAGKWYVKGFVILDKDQPQNSKVEATLDVAHFITGLPELDKHLNGKLFFDTAQFPVATFVSDKVDVLSDTSAKVQGMLTVHGVTKPVTLHVTLNKVGKNPINDRMTVGFSATTQLKRSDFGIKTLLPDLGDEVAIEIGAEAYQPKP